MPRARKTQIDLEATPYYHCVSRCVRRAYLCGVDRFTKQSYEHRRQWVEQRLYFLASIFAIDLCAYAVMNNHTHIVLRIDSRCADKWTEQEVLRRWHSLHRGTCLTRRYHTSSPTFTSSELTTLKDTIAVYRQRLQDISWFMRELNEYIARKANKEDECTGRFWEGRFKSQALLDDAALLACMVYVDLNPVRAGMAHSPEEAQYTSVRRRKRAAVNRSVQPSGLMPLASAGNHNFGESLPFDVSDYLSLVECSAKRISGNLLSQPKANIVPMLRKVRVSFDSIINLSQHFERACKGAAHRGKLKVVENK